MNDHQNNSFQYTYSAKEQAELKRIRDKYLTEIQPKETDKMEQLRKLDAGVSQKATVISLCVGIISTLIMGFGMSLVMTELKELLGSATSMAPIIGIGIGFAGMIGVIAAYPLYQHIVAKERARIAPEILRLTDELMSDKP